MKKQVKFFSALFLIPAISISLLLIFTQKDTNVTKVELSKRVELVTSFGKSKEGDTGIAKIKEEIEKIEEEKDTCKRYVGEGKNKVCVPEIPEYEKRCHTYTVEVGDKKLCYERDFRFTAYSLEDIKNEGYNVLLKVYENDREFEYYNSYPEKILFLRSTHPDYSDEYAVVMRNRDSNKITAITNYYERGEDDTGKKYIGGFGNMPTSEAFKPGIGPTGITIEQMRERELDIVADFPPIDETGAKKLLYDHLVKINLTPSEVERRGYAVLYAYSPVGDFTYMINTYKHPFHEFVVDGEYFWVNGLDGRIFDEPQLEWITKRNKESYENPLVPDSYWEKNGYDPIKAREEKN